MRLNLTFLQKCRVNSNCLRYKTNQSFRWRVILTAHIMPKQLINPDALYDMGAFGASQAVIDSENSLIYISGQVAWDKAHQVTSNSVAGQFENALENLQIVLQECGANIEGLLHLRIYVRGELEDHMADIAPRLAEFLGRSRPAVTGIGVASLASKATLVEIEAVARIA